MPEITILPFHPEDQAETKQLVLAGMAEHWGKIYFSRNPDLNDIATSYSAAAFLEDRTQGRIVGCGALVSRSEKTAEIVCMSVAAETRRQGIARRTLDHLIEIARNKGYSQVILETIATWAAVIEFYLHFGFHITHYQDSDVYSALDPP
jgi:ribosomal protein S18 acetylase RimI-like enzyme